MGFVLLAFSIRAALNEYRFGLGDENEPYKARFANTDLGLETLAVGAAAGRSPTWATATAGARRLPTRLRRAGLRRSG